MEVQSVYIAIIIYSFISKVKIVKSWYLEEIWEKCMKHHFIKLYFVISKLNLSDLIIDY